MAVEGCRPARIVIVRHGESQWNTQGSRRDIKIKDVPEALRGIPDHKTLLTKIGEKQAEITGQRLAGDFGEFHRIFHSDYARAIQTAKRIIGQFPAEVRSRMVDGMRESLAIAEQNFGDLDLGIIDPDEHEVLNKKFCKLRARVGKFRARPPNGDSWADICLQLEAFKMQELYRPDRHGQNILIVTHSVTMQCFRYAFEHIHGDHLVHMYELEKPANCGVSTYEYDEGSGKYICMRWNQIFYPESLKTEQ